MTTFEHAIISKWLPILQEYELIKQKRSQHFKRVRDLCAAYHVNKRFLYKYYRRYLAANRNPRSLMPEKRGPRYRTRRTPKPIERQIMKAYRHLGAPSYEIVLLFKPYYGTQTPSARTIDRIKARYPLNESQKATIKRYEKRYPGELGHLDSYYLPRSLSTPTQYVLALLDDCTRLTYAEVVPSLQSQAVAYFIARALCWFKQIYGFHFDAIMSDNGSEFKGSPDHFVEGFLRNLGIEHWYTPPYHPEPNGKVEAFFKILQTELLRAHYFKDINEFKEQLGAYIFDYNHCRRHGGIEYQTPYEKLEKVTELLT
jgi:hypothetical protein